MYQDQSDGTLVMLTLAGEQCAYEILVTRYEQAVIAAANSVLHSRYMAEDAAQDAFVTAWMKLNILREPEKYGAWICRIARNCAKNMVVRYRSYLSLDVLENCMSEDEHEDNPEALYVSSEEKKQLHESVSRLPEKVRQVIHLYYFEELSVAEIAERMGISTGTVKWQLHDGRKRIRKEMCAMDEQMNDTLVQRVMKKVEELKKWQFKNSKNGFEVAYRDVLREAEELPESADKYHALADVLMRGWWWIPGEKNDALFDRIREAAELGKNDDVMKFIAVRESENFWGDTKLAFIRDTQIPRLEKGGFVKALGSAWFWLGYYCFESERPDDGFAAYEKVLSILKPADVFHAYALAAIEMEKQRREIYGEKSNDTYRLRAIGEEYRIQENGNLRGFDRQWYGRGLLCSADLEIDFIFRNASYCDGYFTVDGLAVGETYVGSDGTTLTFGGDNETVRTACGVWDECELWITKHDGSTYRTWFKSGVGIVRQERICDSMTEVRTLKAYTIVGGTGRIPCAAGNTWEYTADYAPDMMLQASKYTMCWADGDTVTLTGNWSIERLKYDENSWVDMIQQIRNDYFREVEGRDRVCDVTFAMERAALLAKTPVEKAHTKAACSVARRIMETNPEFNPSYTETGHWNFFSRSTTERQDGKITCNGNFRWSFELKNMENNTADTPLLYNDIYGILQDTADCIWSDHWKPGASFTIEYMLWGDRPVKTKIRCEDAGTVTTKAGVFADCMTVYLDISGFSEGWEYRGGKKEYTFAPGIGIVRTVNSYCQDACRAVYELTAYEGTGEGYMPLADGMIRRYDALDLTDGYIAGAEYTYAADEEGRIAIMADRAGTRKKPENITQYSSIYGEVIEEQLWDAGKHPESRLRHDVNNFRLLTHFLGRPSRHWAAQEKAVAWNKYRMRIMEGLGGNGEVPPAWWGHYASTCFRTACSLFGCGRNDEGYEYLERAFALFEKWNTIADGEEMEVGDPLIYGGVKVIKGKGIIRLPDGTTEPLSYNHLFNDKSSLMHYGMTAPHGWEWFNGVRNEERFKAYIRRAEKLIL